MSARAVPPAPAPGSPELEAALAWSTGEDERHVARTADGWNVALYRYRARGTRRPVPVVLGHGLAGSRLLFDVHPDYSLARALAERGFDTWLVDLRGRNESWPDGGARDELQWCFDDFVALDLPAALDVACTVADAPQAWWVGTEMSGLALYAAVIARTTPRLLGGVAMGASAVTPAHAQVPGVTTPYPERDGTRYRFSMVRDIGPTLAVQRSDALESSFRAANTDWRVPARYFRHGVPDEATDLVDQLKDWVAEGSMRTRDSSIVYSDRLDEVTLPVLAMAGAADLQRPAPAQRVTFDALGSPDKEFVLASADTGFPVDVGHDDLVAGLSSPELVFPRIADWIDRRSG